MLKAVLFQKFALQTSFSQKVCFSGLIILDVCLQANKKKQKASIIKDDGCCCATLVFFQKTWQN